MIESSPDNMFASNMIPKLGLFVMWLFKTDYHMSRVCIRVTNNPTLSHFTIQQMCASCHYSIEQSLFWSDLRGICEHIKFACKFWLGSYKHFSQQFFTEVWSNMLWSSVILILFDSFLYSISKCAFEYVSNQTLL